MPASHAAQPLLVLAFAMLILTGCGTHAATDTRGQRPQHTMAPQPRNAIPPAQAIQASSPPAQGPIPTSKARP